VLELERIPISEINPAAYNPRQDLRPGDPEYEQLKRSIETWGLVEPLVWNRRTGNLVGGHQRLKILIQRGDAEVDVSVVDLDPENEKALNLALNKIQGDWDEDALRALLEELSRTDIDLELTGFSETELTGLLQDIDIDSLALEMSIPHEPAEKKPIVCPQCGYEFE
jgi:ParB-like chromosome segregation protein Spo0J